MSRHSHAYTAVDQYAHVGLRTDVEAASPHRLILLLLDGAVGKLRAARIALEHGNIAHKGANISWCMSIIDGLRASLDLERGGDIAGNLDRLYDYMTRALVDANLHNDDNKLGEVEAMLSEIRAGWKGIETTVDTQPRPAHNNVSPNAVAAG